MNDLWLYHATNKKNLPSIMERGLLSNPPAHNWEEMYVEDQVFLAFSAKDAVCYCSELKMKAKDIAVLRIKLTDLDEDSLRYDWNNRCEYSDEINSVSYEKDIPAKVIQLVSKVEQEPIQNIRSFRKTQMYNNIMDTFEYEVETNKEMEE